MIRESGTFKICQWTTIGIMNNEKIIDMTFNQKCPSYPEKPLQDSEKIIFDHLNNLQKDLKIYIQTSYCDSIQPNYRIPILDHTKDYSCFVFYPFGFQDINISSDEGLYFIINY